MICPTCESPNTRVSISRDAGQYVRRLRVCCDCARRWRTVEVTEEDHERAEKVMEIARRFRELMPSTDAA